MEGNIVTERVLVRERPEGSSPVIADLRHGDRVWLGQATFRRAWVEVRLPDGRVGHIRGETATRTEPMSLAYVVGGDMKIRSVRDLDTEPGIIARDGQIVACGEMSNAQYISWTEVALPDGQIGYVEGEPRAQRIVWSQVAQKKLIMRNAPNPSGAPVKTLDLGSIIGVGPAASFAAHPWLRAVLPDRTEGFIPPDTQITRLDAETRTRRLLIFPGKCACCQGADSVRMVNLHMGGRSNRQLHGDCFVPVCYSCISRRFYRNLVILFAFGTATIVGTALTGYELLGAIGYVPFGYYTMNAAQKGGTLRRYRRVAEARMTNELASLGMSITDLTYQQETELDEIWRSLSKWIVCPGCLKLHTDQAPWCPHCGYLFPWRFGPRP